MLLLFHFALEPNCAQQVDKQKPASKMIVCYECMYLIPFGSPKKDISPIPFLKLLGFSTCMIHINCFHNVSILSIDTFLSLLSSISPLSTA